jgi:hypothetical protein
MATSPNFGWLEPDNTDLVKNGALAIRTLGDAIDASLVDLKGGTTDQVLAKNSNTDMDFKWVSDATGMTNPMTTTGDVIYSSSGSTPARLGIGTAGQVLQVNSGATAPEWAAPSSGAESLGFTAGKNKILNADFAINQRSFTSSTTDLFGFDRWRCGRAGDGTATFSAETFTLGTAPVTGYEAKSFIQVATTGQTQTGVQTQVQQRIESVRTFANQTSTISFWAKATSGTPKVAIELVQNFGTGGSPSSAVNNYVGEVTLSTSWTRYSVSYAVPSISGKTIGTDSNSDYLQLGLWTSAGTDFNSRTNSLGIQTATIGIWGVQVEAGSTATAFQTATGSIQGELSACQRYYESWTAAGSNYGLPGAAAWNATTGGKLSVQFMVPKRVAPSVAFSNILIISGTSSLTVTSLAFFGGGSSSGVVGGYANFGVASGGTVGHAGVVMDTGSGNGFINWSAEL